MYSGKRIGQYGPLYRWNVGGVVFLYIHSEYQHVVEGEL